ncbi:MAG: tRNA (N6-isopentenyl adenosine(37)-C2)-methylthiotransferase MiaB [Candidatus Marinimicrobia bacterium CG_4_10_14_0_2_um_filter_48_9]|nr:MAG: tRNA (N6-isopentenyl adenosine(37)-C2)-methylthiotransferase MiaB [Candidatus Marinimicrobia bacterium CG_4_10_14_0_2_um_filter_48_9]
MKQTKTYYIETYGCQMNVYDSELVAGIMERESYLRAESVEQADIIFLNTCSVREHAEDKVHARLGVLKAQKEKKPGTIIGVLGCMAQNLRDDLLIRRPYVDVVLGPDSYRRIPDLLNERLAPQEHIVDTKLSRMEVYEGLFPARREGVGAWVSIIRGCDKFCTFCIVPFTRGRERSRTVESIVTEVQQIVAEGFKEITLLGQNVNSYLSEGVRFPELLEIVTEIEGLERVRYTSPHPQDFNDTLIAVHATHPKVCNHVHFPLQAGSDQILERMNRTYTQSHFVALAQKMRSAVPGLSITTDIIVGFPGETEEDFQETLDVMNAVKFDSAFTFKYSPRAGTKAAEFKDSVPEDVKQDRLERLIEIQRQHTLEQNEAHIGEVHAVLVEKDSKKSSDQHMGRTRNNKIVVFDKGSETTGDIINVRITGAGGITLFGELA